MIEGIQGGNMLHGFMTAGVSAAGNAELMKYKNQLGKVGLVVSSAVVGGTASAVGGGKFANGAITGAYLIMFNEFKHNGEDDEIERQKQEFYERTGMDPDQKVIMGVDHLPMPGPGSIKTLFQVIRNIPTAIKNMGSLLRFGKNAGSVVRFGKDANQQYHTFRHMKEIGLDISAVEKAVRADIPNIASKIQVGKPFNQIINVGGKTYNTLHINYLIM